MKIALELIQPSPNPVRTTWDEDKMNELAQSIREQGVIVPVKVRPVNGNGHYELVYGHRRVEAARRADLTEIEAVVEGVEDDAVLVQALIENIQRENMSDFDEGGAYIALRERGLSSAQIGAAVGKAYSYIDRCMRLARDESMEPLRHPGVENQANKAEDIQRAIHDADIRQAVARKVAEEGLTRTQTSRVAQAVAAAPSPEAKRKLIEWEYSPTIHDPANIQERAREYGAHDALYHDDTPTKQAQWEQTPEIKAVVNGVLEAAKMWTRLIKQTRSMAEIGKMAPESRQFIAHRARTLAKTLTDWANELEARSDD